MTENAVTNPTSTRVTESRKDDHRDDHRAHRPNVIIDPVTRIEGHLRIQATAVPTIDSHGKNRYLINKPALSASTMVRGVERILEGRDPRDAWAFTQRICGVCTVVHGLTSVRAVENAIGIKIPKNADYIRNMMIGGQYVHDHVMHFYHLHALDWVDVESALDADIGATVKLARKNNQAFYEGQSDEALKDAFTATQEKLTSLATNNQLGPFADGYWGHPAYKLSPEANLLLVSHYLEALKWARDVVLLHTIFGGKDPHPDLLVGGMQCTLSEPEPGAPATKGTSLNDDGFKIVQGVITKMKTFVDQVYLPDVVFLAGAYKEWADYGGTDGNFLSFGEYPDPGLVRKEFEKGAIDYPEGYVIPQGVIWKGNMRKLEPFDERLVTENVAHAWYSYASGVNLHPSRGETELDYRGIDGKPGPAPDQPNPMDYMLDEHDKYSWMKSPRYKGRPVEVGPLAHVLMMHARNKLDTDKLVRSYVKKYWQDALKLPFEKLNSTLGRIFSRTLETKIIGDKMQDWYDGLLANKAGYYSNSDTERRLKTPGEWPTEVGFGFTEAPRGALGHWVKIDPNTSTIANYQCIVASQWNAGPRDANDVPGPYEQSLQGHFLHDPTQPLEVLRTIHSFDPCIGCAVHIVDPNGEPLVQVQVNHTYR